uniref:Uncharacterized protein n=1 Tax=Glossina palpalis gambiensis TaxID=67801 RepID=A0A1B0C3D5_9MUSC
MHNRLLIILYTVRITVVHITVSITAGGSVLRTALLTGRQVNMDEICSTSPNKSSQASLIYTLIYFLAFTLKTFNKVLRGITSLCKEKFFESKQRTTTLCTQMLNTVAQH